ncbi:MAG: SEC-C metal-binding domain-containing protein, partial [Verrucomicrobiota bacterium]
MNSKIQLSILDPCPCGTGQSFGECCRPFVVDSQFAPTPELLMRSRYTALFLRQYDYITR